MTKRTIINLIITMLVLCISVGALVFAKFQSEKILAEKIVPDPETIEKVRTEKTQIQTDGFLSQTEMQGQEIIPQASIITPKPTPSPTPEPTHPPECTVVSGTFTEPEDTYSSLDYELVLPANYSGKLPLIVYLYGDQKNNVKDYGIFRQAEELYGTDFPFALLFPKTAGYTWEGWIPDTLCHMIERLAEDYDINMDHIYLTGHGRGGLGTWVAADSHESFFKAIVPLCAGMDIREENFKNVAVWAMCGDGWYDRDNYSQWMQYLTEVVEKGGGEGKFSIVECGENGDISTLAYTQDVFEWMLAH